MGPASVLLTAGRQSLLATGEGAQLDTRPSGGLPVLQTVRDQAACKGHCEAVRPAPAPRKCPSHGAAGTQAGSAGSGHAPARPGLWRPARLQRCLEVAADPHGP